MKICFKGIVKDGALTFHNPERFFDYLKVISGPVEVWVSKWYSARSKHQNNFYWKCVVGLIAAETGNTSDEIHELMKSIFLKRIVYILTKSGVQEKASVRSTTELTTKEFEEYLESIRRWSAQELGVIIPEPNEVEA